MAYNYDYPYVDTGRQNADWMLKSIKDFAEELARLASIVDTFDITKEQVEDAAALDAFFQELKPGIV